MLQKKGRKIATLLIEDGWRKRTLKELYDTVSSELRKELIVATGYSYPTAMTFIEHPYERSLADLIRFSDELGVSFEEVILPMTFKAMQRTPSIHERMVINPTCDKPENLTPENLTQGRTKFAAINPAGTKAGDRVLVKGSWQGNVFALNEEEGRILVEFENGVMEQFDLADVLVIEEEEEEEDIEREGRALLREALQYLELPFQIGDKVAIRNWGIEGTIEDVSIDGGVNNPLYRVRHEHGWINCYADLLCHLQEEEEMMKGDQS